MEFEELEDVAIELDDFGVLTVTLNRPEKLNALTPAMRRSLKALPRLVASDDRVKAVVLTGAGRGFCSGADMSQGAANPYPAASNREGLKESRYGWMATFRDIPKPMIAAVNGPAAGGGLSIALACDVRFASQSAKFSAVWVRRGLVPDMGASKLLVDAIGPSRALMLIWSGEVLDAESAAQIGLVDRVIPDTDLMPAAIEYARNLAAGPSVAIELSKRLVQFATGHTLEESTVMEELFQGITTKTQDVAEGRLAFQEKRNPHFTGI